MRTDFYFDEEDAYCLGNDGVLRTGGWFWYVNRWYCADSSGKVRKGWFKDSGKWYYLYPHTQSEPSEVRGHMLGQMWIGWRNTDDKWYYLDNDGAMVSGDYTIDGKTRHFADSGELIGDPGFKKVHVIYKNKEDGTVVKESDANVVDGYIQVENPIVVDGEELFLSPDEDSDFTLEGSDWIDGKTQRIKYLGTDELIAPVS